MDGAGGGSSDKLRDRVSRPGHEHDDVAYVINDTAAYDGDEFYYLVKYDCDIHGATDYIIHKHHGADYHYVVTRDIHNVDEYHYHDAYGFDDH